MHEDKTIDCWGRRSKRLLTIRPIAASGCQPEHVTADQQKMVMAHGLMGRSESQCNSALPVVLMGLGM